MKELIGVWYNNERDHEFADQDTVKFVRYIELSYHAAPPPTLIKISP